VPGQDLLLPPSLQDWLPEDHVAYFVSDLIDQSDLSAITTMHEDEERPYPPYHPGITGGGVARGRTSASDAWLPPRREASNCRFG
jgi:hypothetical protein